MLAKLKQQCPTCTSELYIESTDDCKAIGVEGDDKLGKIFTCPICNSDVKIVWQKQS